MKTSKFLTVAFAILLLINSKTYSQDFQYKGDKIFYEYIDTISDFKQNELFDLARIWAKKYDNTELILEDKDGGKLLAKSVLDLEEFSGTFEGKHPTSFKLDITCRDNRIRLQVFELKYDKRYDMEIVKSARSDKKRYQEFTKIINQTNHQINYLHKSLINSLKQKDTF